MTTTLHRCVRVEDLPDLDRHQIALLADETITRDGPARLTQPPHRRARPWVIGVGAAAVAAAFVIGSSTGIVPTEQAQAWSPVPAAPSPGDVESFERQCAPSMLPPAGVAQEFSVGGSGETPVPGPVVTLPPAVPTTAPVVALAERRGQSFAMVMSNGGLCLFFAGAMSAGVNSWGPPPIPSGADITVVMSGFAGGWGVTDPATDGDDDIEYVEAYTAVVAAAGPDVAAADVTTSTGQQITATVAGGWILAWWPTDDEPADITVTTDTGSSYTQPATRP